MRLRAIDLIGKRYNRLTVIARATLNAANGDARWICECDCGQQCVVDSYRLRKGRTKSCGCLRREDSARRSSDNAAFIEMKANNASQLKNEDGICYSSLRRSKRNRSGHIGVSYVKRTGLYVARLRYNGKYVLNKTVTTYERACQLREEAEDTYLHQLSETAEPRLLAGR